MYIESVPNRNSPPAVPRESYRLGGSGRQPASRRHDPPELQAAARRSATTGHLKPPRAIPWPTPWGWVQWTRTICTQPWTGWGRASGASSGPWPGATSRRAPWWYDLTSVYGRAQVPAGPTRSFEASGASFIEFACCATPTAVPWRSPATPPIRCRGLPRSFGSASGCPRSGQSAANRPDFTGSARCAGLRSARWSGPGRCRCARRGPGGGAQRRLGERLMVCRIRCWPSNARASARNCSRPPRSCSSPSWRRLKDQRGAGRQGHRQVRWPSTSIGR